MGNTGNVDTANARYPLPITTINAIEPVVLHLRILQTCHCQSVLPFTVRHDARFAGINGVVVKG